MNKPGVVVCLSCLAAIGVVFIRFSRADGDTLAFFIGAVATGMGTAVICLMTGKVFGTLGIREILTAGCLSVMLAALLYFMGISLKVGLQTTFIALPAPVIRRFFKRDPKPEIEHGHKSCAAQAWSLGKA